MLEIKSPEQPQHQTSLYHRNCNNIQFSVPRLLRKPVENSLFDRRGCRDIFKGKPRLAARFSASVLIFLFSPLPPFSCGAACQGVSRGHANRRERSLMPSNPLITPSGSVSAPAGPFFIALCPDADNWRAVASIHTSGLN